MGKPNQISDWTVVTLFPGISKPRAAGFSFYDTEEEAKKDEDVENNKCAMPWSALPTWVQHKLATLNILSLEDIGGSVGVKHVSGVGGKTRTNLWIEYDRSPEFEQLVKSYGKEASDG